MDLLEEDLRRNLTGDVDLALSDDRGLCSASSVVEVDVSGRCLVGSSTEVTEFRDLRPRVGVVDAVTVECTRPPSAVDKGREEAFERLPFGMFRVIDDTVCLEAMGVVGVLFLSAAVTVRLGGIPFFGDALCRVSLFFLVATPFIGLVPGAFSICSSSLLSLAGEPAIITEFPGVRA